MIAAELALRLDADLELESTDAIWAEIEHVAPAHAGLTLDHLASPLGTDGFVVPMPEDEAVVDPDTADTADADATDALDALDATDGEVAAVEPEAAVGGTPAADPADEVAGDAPADEPEPQPRRPALLAFTAPGPAPDSHDHDAYSLRLVSSRTLYDGGTLVAHAPSLSGLAPDTAVHLSPKDFDRLGLGVTADTQVRVRSARGEVTVPAVSDPGLPQGSASLAFRQSGASAGVLIDSSAPVTDVRVETAGSQ